MTNQMQTLKVQKSKGKNNKRTTKSGFKEEQLLPYRELNVSDSSEMNSSQASFSKTEPKRRQNSFKTAKQIGKNRPVFEIPYKQDPYQSIPQNGFESKEEEDSMDPWVLTAQTGKSEQHAASQGTCNLSENSSFN